MKRLIGLIRRGYYGSGMIAKIYAAVLLAAFLPFVIIFILLWRYCSGLFSDSVRQSALESFRSRQKQLQIFADEYTQIRHHRGGRGLRPAAGEGGNAGRDGRIL